MKKHKLVCIVLAIGISISILDVHAQVECCSDTVCLERAKDYVNALTQITRELGPAPSGREATETSLRNLKDSKPNAYKNLQRAIKEFTKWVGGDGQKSRCFTRMIPLDDLESGRWVSEIISFNSKAKSKPAVFCRGIGLQLEGSLGPTDLGKKSEGFGAHSRLLLSYTFAPTDTAVHEDNLVAGQHCGGHVRLLAGLGHSFIDRTGLLSIVARAEVRLFPLNINLGTLGAGKFLVQYGRGLNRQINIYGLGLGLDLDFLGIFLMHHWTNRITSNFTEVGFVYKFKL